MPGFNFSVYPIPEVLFRKSLNFPKEMAAILQFMMVRVFYTLQQGNLLRGIDNLSVSARSVFFFISTQKHKRGYQISYPW